MVSKLKQRRLRRLKAKLISQQKEIALLRRMVIRVPMPVVVPESVADELKLRDVYT
ncbi:hypothetical protein [Kosakonia radicincitans]|uniref:hypothetical protein n=1 Tax=Kosakonia radicincitans TaxID=283686 RepID=UPI000272DF31|nr:hypothetical protein [Kosakonia radicincitans]